MASESELVRRLIELQDRVARVENQLHQLAQAEGHTAPHGDLHGGGGLDEVSIMIQEAGTPQNRLPRINFTSDFTVAQDSVNKRHDIALAVSAIGAWRPRIVNVAF